MINKIADSVAQALSGIQDGSTVLIGGFGTSGIPGELIDGLIAQGARELTVVNNNAGNGDTGLAALIVGDFIDLVCPDLRDVLDFCLRVHRLHDFCSDLLADFRRALQHEQAAPDTQTDDCQNPVLHNTNPFP